jgi:hypothetical protein
MLRTEKTKKIPEKVVLPVSLYQSIRGRYFVGYADNAASGKISYQWWEEHY